MTENRERIVKSENETAAEMARLRSDANKALVLSLRIEEEQARRKSAAGKPA